MEPLPASYRSFSGLFDTYYYPAGESHVALRDPITTPPGRLAIEANITSFEALGQMLTADRILRHNRVRAEWFVPYFPFARHDRRNHCGDGFELGLALDMVRDLDIVIADPHSDVAGQLRHIPQTASVDLFRQAAAFAPGSIAIIPDTGATKKAHEWATDRHRSVQALKHRDPATGSLSGFEVLADDLGGAPCVIVDDICDGGGTFVGLAKALDAANAGPLTLAVTHGLFTKDIAALSASFDRIITFGYADDTSRIDGVDYLPFKDLYTKGARR